jgi:RHS repeat-associated protein
LGNDTINAVQYQHDLRGNMRNLANVTPDQYIHWDYRDMIQGLNLGGGGRVYYNYDSGKERTRKINETQAGAKQWERIYLGGLEIYRKYNGVDIVEEIESIHLVDGNNRLLLVEDVIKTDGDKLQTGPLYRYQYGNHLGSAVLELDNNAAIVSYEEYHPYGTTSYRAVNGNIKTTAKRYRYTGKERDEESGLYYHGARYYAAWLGRWVSCDPAGMVDGLNLYTYTRGNPCCLVDKSGTQSKKGEVSPEVGSSGDWSNDYNELSLEQRAKYNVEKQRLHQIELHGGENLENKKAAVLAHAGALDVIGPSPVLPRFYSLLDQELDKPDSLLGYFPGFKAGWLLMEAINGETLSGQQVNRGAKLLEAGFQLSMDWATLEMAGGLAEATGGAARAFSGLGKELALAETKAAGTTVRAGYRASVVPPKPIIVKNKVFAAAEGPYTNGVTYPNLTLKPAKGILGKVGLKEPTFNPTIMVKKGPQFTTKPAVIRHESQHAFDELNFPQFAYMGTTSLMPGRGTAAYIMEARGYYAEFGFKGLNPRYILGSMTKLEKGYLAGELTASTALGGYMTYRLLSKD